MGGEEVVRIWGKARRWFLRVMYKLKQDRYGDITYVLRNKKSKSDFLIAVFSGFSPKGAAPRYNYGETLKKVDAMQVFLLDDTGYNKAGSYYLGENGTIRYNKLRKFRKGKMKTVPKNKGQGQRHLVE